MQKYRCLRKGSALVTLGGGGIFRRGLRFRFVSVVFRCQCFVAHAGVAFDGASFVVALEWGHNVFHSGLEPVVHTGRRQSKEMKVFGFPDGRVDVHGRRGHQPDQHVVLPEGYFLVWLLRVLCLQCWVNRGHERAQLVQVLLVTGGLYYKISVYTNK